MDGSNFLDEITFNKYKAKLYTALDTIVGKNKTNPYMKKQDAYDILDEVVHLWLVFLHNTEPNTAGMEYLNHLTKKEEEITKLRKELYERRKTTESTKRNNDSGRKRKKVK